MNKDIDYCGMINMLRQLVRWGKCTENEAHRIAKRIAKQNGITIILPADFHYI